mgnify:CR=1 FL=1
MQAVEIEPAKCGVALTRLGKVVGAEPFKEVGDHAVAPHPARKADEIAKRILGVGVVSVSAHPAGGAIRIGPVRFHGDDVEAT